LSLSSFLFVLLIYFPAFQSRSTCLAHSTRQQA
jgi:hypothetical protein